MSDAAPGSFKVTVNSVQADGNHVRGAWQLPKFPGLEARSDVLKPIVIDSDLCVSSGSVAFGFHDRACAQEFVDPQSLRQSGGTPETTGVTPRPTPTPTHTSTQPTPIRPPQVTKPLAVGGHSPITVRSLYTLALPGYYVRAVVWHCIRLFVHMRLDRGSPAHILGRGLSGRGKFSNRNRSERA